MQAQADIADDTADIRLAGDGELIANSA